MAEVQLGAGAGQVAQLLVERVLALEVVVHSNGPTRVVEVRQQGQVLRDAVEVDPVLVVLGQDFRLWVPVERVGEDLLTRSSEPRVAGTRARFQGGSGGPEVSSLKINKKCKMCNMVCHRNKLFRTIYSFMI